jgi:hypothetical protein
MGRDLYSFYIWDNISALAIDILHSSIRVLKCYGRPSLSEEKERWRLGPWAQQPASSRPSLSSKLSLLVLIRFSFILIQLVEMQLVEQ